MEDKRANTVLIVIAAMFPLPALYVGSYVLLLEDGGEVEVRLPADIVDVNPRYRVDASAVELFFMPVHAVDRRLRPERWSLEANFNVIGALVP